LREGEATQICLPILLNESNLWEFRVGRRHGDCTIKLSSPWLHSKPSVGVLQNFNLKVNTQFGPGRHFVGTLVFSRRSKKTGTANEDDNVTVFLYVDIPLKNYVEIAQTETYGAPFKMLHNEKHNCIILVDPFGPTHNVPIRKDQQLELLLQQPKGNGYFTFDAKMHIGQCIVVSNDEWKLYDYGGSRYQRILLRFEGYPIEGEITLYENRSNETRKVGHVTVTSCLLESMLPVEDDYSTIDFQSDSEILKNPLDGETLYLNPHAYSIIRFNKPDKHLVAHLAGASHPSQICFETKRLSYLLNDKDSWLDQENPWNSFCGLQCTGAEPWNSVSYGFNPIKESQPRFNEIMDAIELKAGTRMAAVEIGSLECTYRVSDVFHMTTKIGIGVRNCGYLNTFFGESPAPKYDLTNPPDTCSFDIFNGKALRIRLPAKKKTVERAEIRVPWTLMSTPSWLFSIGNEEEKNGDQAFYFYCHLPYAKKARKGLVRFDCGNLVKRLTLVGYR
jgi:hypothetical protein